LRACSRRDPVAIADATPAESNIILDTTGADTIPDCAASDSVPYSQPAGER
jgi:hypothetical protein